MGQLNVPFGNKGSDGRVEQRPRRLLAQASVARETDRLARSLRHFRSLFDGAPTAQAVLGSQGEVLQHNRAFVRMFGGGLHGSPLVDLAEPDSRPLLEAALRALCSGKPVVCRGVFKGQDDSVSIQLIGVGMPRDPASTAAGQSHVVLIELSGLQAELVHLLRRVEELKTRNDALAELVQVDPLTGVGNRRAAEQTLRQEVARGLRTKTPPLATLIDCDDFKQINEAFGLANGDLVLEELAQRVAAELRPSDHISRVGGDEFLVLLPETGRREGMGICERLRRSVADRPFVINGQKVKITISIALVPLGGHATSLDAVLTATHGALKESKATGKNKITGEFPSTGFMPLKSLCEGHGLRAVMQPIVEMKSGSPAGGELLSRSNHPLLELPRDFLYAAREAGALVRLDLQCLQTCIERCIRSCLRSTGSDFFLHFNVTCTTLLSQAFDRVLSLLAPLSHSHGVCLELSEHRLPRDPSPLVAPLRRLKNEGIKIAIEDVSLRRGTLESLLVLEPDFFKIGRSVLFDERDRRLDEAGSCRSLRRSMSRFKRILDSLEVRTVAIGIENQQEAKSVRELGLDYGQGFYFGFPR